VPEKVWKWGHKLSWELFSETIYNYRQTIFETKRHKLHMHCKNGFFSATASLEAFLNETLLQKGWSATKLDNNKSYSEKLKHLIKDFSENCIYYKKFDEIKKVRNNYLARDDYLYAEKINPKSLLETIEAIQEIIARVCFENKEIQYPYWISGLNFINPKMNDDICLQSDYEFWLHVHYSCIDNQNLIKITNQNSLIEYPSEWTGYKKLYEYIWDGLKHYKFDIEIEKQSKSFPHMLYLSCKYW
jgi:hypothetical protein